MRKVVSILLLSLFIVTNSGMAMTMHFCRGNFSGVDFGTSRQKCACKIKHKCCTSKTVQIKLRHSFQKNSDLQNTSNQVRDIPVYPVASLFYAVLSNNNVPAPFWDYSPPLPPGNPLLLNKVFRI